MAERAAPTSAPTPTDGAAPTPEPTPAPTATPTPSESPTDGLLGESQLDRANNTIETPCLLGDGTFCGVLRELGVSEGWARALTGYGGAVVRVVVILLVAAVLRWLLLRAISRLAEGIAEGDSRPGLESRLLPLIPLLRRRRQRREAEQRRQELGQATEHVAEGPPGGPLAFERRAQRARTIGSVLRSITTGTIGVLTILAVLGEFNVNVAPLIAGAGVAGVALGFGAQSLVKDFLSGIFLIAEDQYGVGDVVDLGDASGSVEAVGLRVTRVRSVDGTVWYIRNGEILRVGNQSQGWARAVIDVEVAAGEDISRAQTLIGDVAHDLFTDPDWAPLALEEPEVWGVEALTAGSVVLRMVVKTVPLEQWKVARELRRRIKARFDAEGVQTIAPQRTVWLNGGEAPVPAPAIAPDRHPPPHGEADVAADIDPVRTPQPQGRG